jgi:hypothetical protein
MEVKFMIIEVSYSKSRVSKVWKSFIIKVNGAIKPALKNSLRGGENDFLGAKKLFKKLHIVIIFV